MAEVYPEPNELLNIESDSETGVEYIATGTAPYYMQFRKLLYRLRLKKLTSFACMTRDFLISA
jgi:hypothetical protein